LEESGTAGPAEFDLATGSGQLGRSFSATQ
jgi:hypothetical protein